MDMDEIDSIFDQEKDAFSLDLIEKLSKITGCTEEMAKDILKIIRTMKPGEDDEYLLDDKEIIRRKYDEISRLYDYLEDNDLMDDYEAYEDTSWSADSDDDDPWKELED